MAGGWSRLAAYFQLPITRYWRDGGRVQGTGYTVHSSTELETSISPSDCCSHQPPVRLLTGHRGKLDLENEAAAGCGGRGAERGAAEEGHLHEIVSRGGCGPVTATAPATVTATPRPADNFSISALEPRSSLAGRGQASCCRGQAAGKGALLMWTRADGDTCRR